MPARLWSNLGDDERTSLLLHELAHLRRRDHWVRWGELAIAGLYWWHPAVWWIRRALREAEEQCCDAWVVWAMPRGARTYATALLAAIEFVSGIPTVPPAAASATLGNGHVSSLKRRLRMIVKARTPKGLSWAGRLAVAGLSALLLPLAPSWGQKDDTVAEAQYQVAAADLFKTDMQLIDAKAALEKAQANRGAAEPLEDRIREEFKKDSDVQPLIEKLIIARETLKRNRDLARRANDPSVVAVQRQLDTLTGHWNELWQQKKVELAARLQDDEKDAKPKQAKTREATERIEKELKALKEKLGKDLSPVGDEVRKSLERALDEVQKSLKKDGMTAEDLRRAVEKSRNEMRESLKRGGPVEKEMRLAAERARKDMQEAMERSMKETERVREEIGARMREVREQQRKAAEQVRDAHQKEMQARRKRCAARPSGCVIWRGRAGGAEIRARQVRASQGRGGRTGEGRAWRSRPRGPGRSAEGDP